MTSRPLENCVVIFQLRLLATDVIKEQMSLVENQILADLMIYLNGSKIGILKNTVQMPKPDSIVLLEMKEMLIFPLWSEMLRLPYFNPIRHLIINPMHCLFLGIAKWIVKKLWIDSGKLSKSDLKLMENRAKQIKLPANMS